MSFTLRPIPSKGIPRLRGRVAVVTGAARGIGRAVAILLREKGAHVALVDIDAAALTRLHGELGASRTDQRVSMHVTDVADHAALEQLAGDVTSAHGDVHVLVNCAGIAHEAPFIRTSAEDWDRLIAVNLLGVIHSCRAFLPSLARSDRGHIVNISSLLGIVAMPGQCAYSATKFAVRGFSESLQEELHATTVGLTVVHPGAVATGIMRRARGDDPEMLRHIDGWYERNAAKPARVAELIVRAIERGTPRLLVGSDSVLADLLKRLMPVAGNRLFVNATIKILGLGHMRAKRLAQWRDAMLGAKAKSTGAPR